MENKLGRKLEEPPSRSPASSSRLHTIRGLFVPNEAGINTARLGSAAWEQCQGNLFSVLEIVRAQNEVPSSIVASLSVWVATRSVNSWSSLRVSKTGSRCLFRAPKLRSCVS